MLFKNTCKLYKIYVRSVFAKVHAYSIQTFPFFFYNEKHSYKLHYLAIHMLSMYNEKKNNNSDFDEDNIRQQQQQQPVTSN